MLLELTWIEKSLLTTLTDTAEMRSKSWDEFKKT